MFKIYLNYICFFKACNIKKIFFLLLIPFFVFSQDYSQYYQTQSNQNGKIYGKVKDVNSSSFLEFATITLINPSISQAVEGTITDSKGAFLIDSLSIGKYQLSVSFIGYETQLINLELTDEYPIKNLKTIKLSSASELLDEDMQLTIKEYNYCKTFNTPPFVSLDKTPASIVDDFLKIEHIMKQRSKNNGHK